MVKGNERNKPRLAEVVIDSLGLIDHAELTFSAGLNVLTGETGAGKTLIVTALGLLSGKRADKTIVKDGSSKALVQGIFEPIPTDLDSWDIEGDELIISREIPATSSRARVRINGVINPVNILSEMMESVVEIHGQNDSTALAKTSVQRSLLDRFAGSKVLSLMEEYQGVYKEWSKARKAAKNARDNAVLYAREVQQLRREIAEIEELQLVEGEEEELKSRIRVMQNVEELAQVYDSCATTINGDDGVQDRLGGLVQQLEQSQKADNDLTDWASRIREAIDLLSEVGSAAASKANSLDSNPQSFEQSMNRLSQLKGLFRLYGSDTIEVLEHVKTAKERIEEIGGGEEKVRELLRQVKSLKEDLDKLANQLHVEREKAAKKLSAAIEKHLTDLAMPKAQVVISITGTDPTLYGYDEVELYIKTNPGAKAVTLAKAASGGERSRIALALKVALADADHTPILVFDEVDAGIGGETALVVGRKLQELAQDRQVFCVTHLAQIAAHSDVHYFVSKEQGADETKVRVNRLEGDEMVGEIARMMSGKSTEVTALEHANSLLESSKRV